jgi:protein import protein ZIM17
LGWFKNLTEEGTHVTIEELAKLQGQKVARGRMDAADSSVLEYSGEDDAQQIPSPNSPSSEGSPKS